MRRIIIFTLLTVALGVIPAAATDLEDMDICLGKAVVARAICKDPLEVNFVAKVRDDIYLFSVFYAKQEARFLVGVGDKAIRIQGKEYLKLTNTVPYQFDKQSKCAVVDFSTPDCPKTEPIVCCSEKTEEDKLDDKFWGRPIPDLLDEDLRRALEAYDKEEENAEDGEAEPAPEQ